MKKAIFAIMVLGLCFGLATADMAQGDTGTTTVTVTVNSIDELTVPSTVAITLETVDGTTPTKYAQGKYEGTGDNGLTYSHNSTTNKKITATAVAGGSNATNDITLKVKVGDQTEQAVVDGGTDKNDIPLWTGIVAGTHTENLTWTADATLAGTQGSAAGTAYTFDVTFTTADV